MNEKVPAVDGRFVCIVDSESAVLAAVISSYLHQHETYPPLFLFPRVKHARDDGDYPFGDRYLSNLSGRAAGIYINNAWARLGSRETVILAGLSGEQKSYLMLPAGSNIVEIGSVSAVEEALGTFLAKGAGEIRCKSTDILPGLVLALAENKRLVIDESAEIESRPTENRRGIVVVESPSEDASPVIAINYARSVDADVRVVAPLKTYEARETQKWIYAWKDRGDQSAFERMKNIATARIGRIDFQRYEYATFFTEGMPYSLIVQNIIPCTHVRLRIRPDIFVLNSLIFDSLASNNSAVVFSPVFFDDEETDEVRNVLTASNYYVRALVGKDASVANLDFNVQFFPYDILHICSHGGEVEGYEMSASFIDSAKKTHTVVFDEVVGYQPVPGRKELFERTRKAFPRKLDGFDWNSDDLDGQKFAVDVYTGMWDCIMNCDGQRKKKRQIEMSCHIACVDSIHQGQFHAVADHSSPLIFNNACWSWSEVAAFFLDGGARGYIGTLWAIGNDDAVVAGKTFYKKIFSVPVAIALKDALDAIRSTQSRDIYVYWGLHFTKFKEASALEESEKYVRRQLMLSARRWVEKIVSTQSMEVSRNSAKVLELVLHELRTNFAFAGTAEFEQKVRDGAKLARITTRDSTQARAESGAPNVRRDSRDLETQYLKREPE